MGNSDLTRATPRTSDHGRATKPRTSGTGRLVCASGVAIWLWRARPVVSAVGTWRGSDTSLAGSGPPHVSGSWKIGRRVRSARSARLRPQRGACGAWPVWRIVGRATSRRAHSGGRLGDACRAVARHGGASSSAQFAWHVEKSSEPRIWGGGSVAAGGSVCLAGSPALTVSLGRGSISAVGALKITTSSDFRTLHLVCDNAGTSAIM